MAFPCNQFGRQEPGTPEEIKAFASSKGVQFLVMEKIEVNGPSTHPVWQYLKSACGSCGGDVSWNFAAKFIVDKNGSVVERNSESPAKSLPKLHSLL
mmetsp:Transcript_4398/g.5918  ORF Transcript_4398/g.5918 Transcript_4398/m.5918 type:complete len:97 (+) Transcript_4398:203-493(+)|eukprot:CAMPEP_0196591858 /NCGR_PEP_ID=MMETSP1081-20130531/71114_1 /TAXON_ID=36882 /ORGANISM="Pyramimonas amylifera, Strain CCMP720" /LENGTH=96 /DNA_ID=CAMNT_0041915369 /DNA_START=202 /DNA_END=492 /DNA_ORIENTATION=-